MDMRREKQTVPASGGDALPLRQATKKQIALFVLACLALTLCLLMVSVASLVMLTYVPGDPDEAGMGAVGVMLGNWVTAFIVLMLQEMFRPVWLVGLILSVALAVRRRNKPRWMWVTSLCSVGTLILMRPSC